MVNTVILPGVALATLLNVAFVAASEKPLSLDISGWTTNDTDLIRMPEEDLDFDYGSSISERKRCPATKKCTNVGGSCIMSQANCDGTVDTRGCKGKKCKCCISERCPATKKCTNAGGSCIKSQANCDGTVDTRGCKGKKCKCCISGSLTTVEGVTRKPTRPAGGRCDGGREPCSNNIGGIGGGCGPPSDVNKPRCTADNILTQLNSRCIAKCVAAYQLLGTMTQLAGCVSNHCNQKNKETDDFYADDFKGPISLLSLNCIITTAACTASCIFGPEVCVPIIAACVGAAC